MGEEDSPRTRRRVFTRWPFVEPLLAMRCDGAQSPAMHAVCRDLSAGGAGLLLDQHVEHGASLVLHLPRLDGRLSPVRGTVTRIRAVRPGQWRVGLRFVEPIDIFEHVCVDPLAGAYVQEHVDPGDIRGRVLLAGASRLDQAIVRGALSRSGAVVQVCERRAVLGACAPRHDVAILCESAAQEHATGVWKVPDMLVDLMAYGFSGKTVLIAPDDPAHARRLARKLPFAAVIVRPYARDAVLRALGQALGIHGGQVRLRQAA